MLKVKDNIDLKELEKFGFTQMGLPMFSTWFKNLDNNIFLSIDEKNSLYKNSEVISYKGQPKNWLDLGGNIYEEIETKEEYIQDLIQAGLVEKV